MGTVNNWVLLSAYILTFLVGLPANLLSLYAFIKKLQDRPSPTDILLLNLTASDLLFLLFLPLKMYEAASNMEWHLPKLMCSITSFIFFSTIYTSSLLLMAVSVDRYLCLAFPIAYRQLRKLIYAMAGSIFIWLFSGAHCSIVFIMVHMPVTNSTVPSTVCYENFSDEQKKVLLPVRLEFFLVLCLVPMLVCIFCYFSCIRILYSRPRICREKKRKAVGMALGTLIVFLVCFLPYNSSHLVGYSSNKSPEWRYYTLLLSTFNTCLDPIIFHFSSSTFRGTARKPLRRLLCRGKTSAPNREAAAEASSGGPDSHEENKRGVS